MDMKSHAGRGGGGYGMKQTSGATKHSYRKGKPSTSTKMSSLGKFGDVVKPGDNPLAGYAKSQMKGMKYGS